MIPEWLVVYLVASFFIAWYVSTQVLMTRGYDEAEAIGLLIGLIGPVVLPITLAYRIARWSRYGS